MDKTEIKTILADAAKTISNGGTHFGERYLRHRPFLVITQVGRPKKHVHTEKAGWAVGHDNWEVFERPEIVDRVSDKMMREAAVIVDILNTKMVKNRFSNNSPDDTVAGYYLEKYQNECSEGLRIWAKMLSISVADDADVPAENVAEKSPA